MCKCLVNVQMHGECANVRMCKCANGRFCTRNLSICTFTFIYSHSYLRINQAIHKRSKKRRLFAHLHILTFSHSHILTFTKHLHINQAFAHFPSYPQTQQKEATICTFAHSHICTLTKHLHISQAIHKRSKKRRQFAHLHILTFAH